jgi:hypothetical protein
LLKKWETKVRAAEESRRAANSSRLGDSALQSGDFYRRPEAARISWSERLKWSQVEGVTIVACSLNK